MSHETAQTAFLAILTLIAVLVGLQVAEELFAPMFVALVLGVVAAPISNRLEKLGLPTVGAALILLVMLLCLAVGLLFTIGPIVNSAIRQAPSVWRELTEILAMLRQYLAGVEDLQATVNEALQEGSGRASEVEEGAPVEVPGVMDALALAPQLAAGLMIFLGTFYFFIVSRESLYERLATLGTQLSVEALCQAEKRVSKYFLTITCINAGLGVAVGVAMTVIGMPDPLIWGLAAFLLNFVLYIGPAAFVMALTIGGIVQFNGAYSFVPALAFVSLNLIEAQFVTPSLVGRHMHMNPLLLFISLVFWLWLWGPVGGIVAIPVLVWVSFVLERLSSTPKGVLTDSQGRDYGDANRPR